MRMWDCHWQDAGDYGEKYNIGVYEAHPSMMGDFDKYRKRAPSRGYVASTLMPTNPDWLPRPTVLIDQHPWNIEAGKLGGIGATGRLQFQRGTVAACWTIENAEPGSDVILFGFDNAFAGKSLPIKEGYSQTYRDQPSTYTFGGYLEGVSKYGNHDFAVERPYLELLARRRGVKLSFAQEKWPRLKALVLGDAKCVHADAERALALFEPDAVCATNNIGRDWPGRVDYWCSLHPEATRDWGGIQNELKRRLEAGRNRPQVWGHKYVTGIDRTPGDEKGSVWFKGSTGLLCVRALRLEGFERIVLSGVPMTRDGGHYYDGKDWTQFDHYTEAWKKLRDELGPFVRSMSGTTKEIFGEPTESWIVN